MCIKATGLRCWSTTAFVASLPIRGLIPVHLPINIGTKYKGPSGTMTSSSPCKKSDISPKIKRWIKNKDDERSKISLSSLLNDIASDLVPLIAFQKASTSWALSIVLLTNWTFRPYFAGRSSQMYILSPSSRNTTVFVEIQLNVSFINATCVTIG